MMRVAIVFALAACSTPVKHGDAKPAPSSDRSHPTPIPVEHDDRFDTAEIHGYAPAAGTWWFDVALPIAARVTVSLDDADRDTTHEVIDEHDHLAIRVTTLQKRSFRILVVHERARISATPPDAAPAIPCNGNKPDFTNPRCCYAKGCNLAQHACQAHIVKVVDNVVEIDMGADRELVRGTRGSIAQKSGGTANDLWLEVVGDRTSQVIVDRKNTLDWKTLTTDGIVTLELPDACR